MIGYALMAPAPPFPVFVLGFVFNGFGIALQVFSLHCPKMPSYPDTFSGRMPEQMGTLLA